MIENKLILNDEFNLLKNLYFRIIIEKCGWETF